MNPTAPPASTTATPPSRKITARVAVLGCITLSPPASMFAIVATLHALGPGHWTEAILVGLVPALPALMMATVIVMWAVSMLAALLVQLGRALRPGRLDASECFNEFFYDWLTSTAIAIITLTPAKRPPRRTTATKPRTAEPAPIPPVSAAAMRREDESLYWVTVQSRATRPGGAREDVKLPGDPVPMPPSTGRHARLEQVQQPTLRADTGIRHRRTGSVAMAGKSSQA